MPMNSGRLYDAIMPVCPIISTSVGDPTNRGTWSYIAAENATAPQISDADNVVATIPVDGKGATLTSEFVASFTDAEYAAMWKQRNTDVEADTVGFAKLWDQLVSTNPINFNTQVAVDLKAALVTAGVLTQPRADAIFSMSTAMASKYGTIYG